MLAFVYNEETYIPIKPEINTREATDGSGYEYIYVNKNLMPTSIRHLKKYGMPKELEEFCFIPEKENYYDSSTKECV